jgi:hypothetical protein
MVPTGSVEVVNVLNASPLGRNPETPPLGYARLEYTFTTPSGSSEQGYIVMMAGRADDEGNIPGLPKITAQSGSNLMTQIDRWLDVCLYRHTMRPQSEYQYITSFKASCEHSHPIRMLMESVFDDPDAHGRTVEQYAIHKSREATAKFMQHRPDVGTDHYLAEALKSYYPVFSVPWDVACTIAALEKELGDACPNALYANVERAQRLMSVWEREVDRLQVEHDSRGPREKVRWMATQPHLAHLVQIVQSEASYAAKSDRERAASFGHSTVTYENQQYHQVEDFEGLMWLRDYVL